MRPTNKDENVLQKKKVKIQTLNAIIGIQTDTLYHLKCQMTRRKQIKS